MIFKMVFVVGLVFAVVVAFVVIVGLIVINQKYKNKLDEVLSAKCERLSASF